MLDFSMKAVFLQMAVCLMMMTMMYVKSHKWKARYDAFHLWINVWVAGKTALSLINTYNTRAARNE